MEFHDLKSSLSAKMHSAEDQYTTTFRISTEAISYTCSSTFEQKYYSIVIQLIEYPQRGK